MDFRKYIYQMNFFCVCFSWQRVAKKLLPEFLEWELLHISYCCFILRSLSHYNINFLSSIFDEQICDLDNDGYLSDKELNLFQKRCFDTPLRKEVMQDIKTIITKNITGGISPHNTITLTGVFFKSVVNFTFIERILIFNA